jgi:hypothetical protein
MFHARLFTCKCQLDTTQIYTTPLTKNTHTENLLKQIKLAYLQRYGQRGPTNHEPLALVTQPSFTVKLTAWTSLAVH